jgi:hypothetical protein
MSKGTVQGKIRGRRKEGGDKEEKDGRTKCREEDGGRKGKGKTVVGTE